MKSWEDVLAPVKKSQSFKTLMQRLKHAYETSSVYPPKDELFRALKLTPFDTVKIVILGQDPYHQQDQANGLAFSVNKGVRIPPSLRNIYQELSRDLNIETPNHGDLSAWATQGVLLLNTTLSVEDSSPTSHQDIGWGWFTDSVIESLNQHESPIVFLLWGAHARSKKRLINTNKHLVLESSHPSPLSARHSFFGCQHFSKANQFLKDHNRQPVDFSIILE